MAKNWLEITWSHTHSHQSKPCKYWSITLLNCHYPNQMSAYFPTWLICCCLFCQSTVNDTLNYIITKFLGKPPKTHTHSHTSCVHNKYTPLIDESIDFDAHILPHILPGGHWRTYVFIFNVCVRNLIDLIAVNKVPQAVAWIVVINPFQNRGLLKNSKSSFNHSFPPS